MFASSGNEFKIWNSDTNELIKEWSVLNKLGSKINNFSIKTDSEDNFFFKQSNLFFFFQNEVKS
jgi:hypothetical protein